MATLPFVVQPRRQPIIEKIGSEESGIIEVERRGYLSTGEKAFVQQVQQFDNGTSEIITVSRRVARKYSLGMDKAYNIVLSIIGGGTADNEADKQLIAYIEQDFAEDLTAVVRGLAAGQTREELIMAACLLRYRVNPDFEISSVNEVHPDIIAGLAALYRDEENRSIEAFNTQEEEETDAGKKSIEEIEKKPVKATKSPSKNTTGD
jgi:hypothetical protein